MKRFMKILGTIGILAALILTIAGCQIDISRIKVGSRDYPDKLYSTDAKDATIYVFRYGDRYFETEHFYNIDFPATSGIPDGEFAKITADVSYLSGGVAGYMNMPEIKKIKSIDTISIDDLDFPSVYESDFGIMKIGDYADGDYIFATRGHAAVYKDGAWLYRYSYNNSLLRDDCRIYYNEGVTEASIDQRIADGVLCCEDYFVEPK